ncbi:MAG: hypothetical protein ACE5MM_03625 [Nitrospiraceae bacterium]
MQSVPVQSQRIASSLVLGLIARLRLLMAPLSLTVILALASMASTAPAAEAGIEREGSGGQGSAEVIAAKNYVQALASGNRVAAGRLDFACQYRMVTARSTGLDAFPADSDPVYAACWDVLDDAHAMAIQQGDEGMGALWPGKGSLVFYHLELHRYAPSFFVMDLLGSPPAGGFAVEVLDSTPQPPASFRLRDSDPVVAATAALVRLRVTYNDPLTSPVSYAPGAYKWANTVKRPRRALKAVTLRWVVLSDLKKLGFPSDIAVLNLPVSEGDGVRTVQVPLVIQNGGYEAKSAVWWKSNDAPEVVEAAVKRVSQLPALQDQIALLNRLLIIDPSHPEALTALSRTLYQALLSARGDENHAVVRDSALADRLNALLWNTYAQTARVDIALGMEMGGFSKPTPADYMYRMIPAMEKLAKVRPQDLENRLRLGTAYRWANDQLRAIEANEALVNEIPAEERELRSRALIELAWSRIAKVAWNRTLEDPGILVAYKEAEEAFILAVRPLDKFSAAYTMGYSLIFAPNRDNRTMLERFTEAHRWFKQVDGASHESWRYLLGNETVKAVIDANPEFQSLFDES